jgi:ATP-binding cassette subfamily C protein
VAARVEAGIDAQARATRALARLTALRTLAVAAGGWLPVVLILADGPALVRRGVTTGMILGALTYLFEGLQPALQTLVRELGGNGLWLFVALGRLLDGAANADDVTVRGTATTVRTPPQGSDLVLRNVEFRHGTRAEPVVAGRDLDVATGDHLAIVGPSGVGKSTLAGLIAGMLQPQVGQVTMGGFDLRTFDAGALAQSRVLIPQEAYVFEGTLEENLAYLAPGASRGQMDEAVDELGLRGLVERLGGYGAALQVSSLSAGERQLVTLARAYLSPADVVILDEATCHLDPTAEARVEHVFARRPGTLIVIAHRISSALRARRVLVMDGTRVMTGDHEDLLARSALYRDLVGYWLA